jgi:GAF domain-containing protein
MLRRFRQEQASNLEAFSLDEVRRQIGIGILTIFAVSGIIINTVLLTTGLSTTDDPSYNAFVISGICLVAIYMLQKKVYTTLALHLPILIFLALFFISPSQTVFATLSYVILIYAAIITRFPIYIALSVVTVAASINQQLIDPAFQYVIIVVVALTMSAIVSYLVYRFESITLSVGRSNRLLQGSSNIAQVINRELIQQQLLENTVNTIRDEFDFYHVQVFLNDDTSTYANLIASTGEAGRQLLIRNHRIPIGSQSVVGRVSQIGEPVVTQNTKADTVHSINELLPDTQAELALPIIDSGNIIGALDVQSINIDAFQPVDVQALQIIANQLAVAIRNASLFEDAEKNLNENKRLVFEYETNLREVDRLNRSLTKQSWDNYLVQTYVNGVTLSKDRFVPKADWSDEMRVATSQQQTHITSSDGNSLIVVPIILRGQVLGAIEVELEGTVSTSDSAEMIQAISQRLAISLESARLFEETQEATLQEQQINEIVTSYETAVTIDELLQITLEKLQQSLGADQGKIRLGTPETSNTSPHTYNGNGGSPS